MFDPFKILRKAYSSGFYLWLLNKGLHRLIPFNRPHGFWIDKLEKHRIRIRLPYRNVNLNHIHGLHACALATVSEYATGFLLISNLDPREYRLILKRLEIDYHYQAKTDAFASYEADGQWLNDKVKSPLASEDSVIVPCTVKVTDTANNQLTTATVTWQVKPWNRVKTKV